MLQLCKVLGRSVGSIKAQAVKDGLTQCQYKAWTQAEEELLRTDFKPEKPTIIQLAKKLQRSKQAVYVRARLLGLCQSNKSKAEPRFWTTEETALLAELNGEQPLELIVKRLNQLCAKHGWTPRSSHAVALKLHNLGFSRRCDKGDWYSVADLAQLFGCAESTVRGWLNDKEFAKALKPQQSSKKQGAHYFVHCNNLKAFCSQWPGEIAKFKPNIPWLIAVLT